VVEGGEWWKEGDIYMHNFPLREKTTWTSILVDQNWNLMEVYKTNLNALTHGRMWRWSVGQEGKVKKKDKYASHNHIKPYGPKLNKRPRHN
jgi:hypothetical protein